MWWPALTSALLILLETFKRKHLTNAAPFQQKVTFGDIVAKKRKRKNKLSLRFHKNVSKIRKGQVSYTPGINISLNTVRRHVAWHTKYTFNLKRNYKFLQTHNELFHNNKHTHVCCINSLSCLCWQYLKGLFTICLLWWAVMSRLLLVSIFSNKWNYT